MAYMPIRKVTHFRWHTAYSLEISCLFAFNSKLQKYLSTVKIWLNLSFKTHDFSNPFTPWNQLFHTLFPLTDSCTVIFLYSWFSAVKVIENQFHMKYQTNIFPQQKFVRVKLWRIPFKKGWLIRSLIFWRQAADSVLLTINQTEIIDLPKKADSMASVDIVKLCCPLSHRVIIRAASSVSAAEAARSYSFWLK